MKGKPSGMTGKKHSDETKAVLAALWTGKKHTAETKAKMAASTHKQWGTEPGVREYARTAVWAKEVKERDEVCQYCGSDEELHAHHIFSVAKWPGLAQNVRNGITLCAPCHREHHSLNYLV